MIKNILVSVGSVLVFAGLVEIVFYFISDKEIPDSPQISWKYVSLDTPSPTFDNLLYSLPKKFPRDDPYANLRGLTGQSLDKSNAGFCCNFGLDQPTVKGFRSIMKLRPSNLVLYDVNYHFDELERRITPQSKTPKKTTFAFMGCSFTMGEGLEDHQTSSAQLAQFNQDLRVLNLGYASTGVHDHAYRYGVLKKNPFADVESETQIIAFNYIDFLIPRLVCPMTCVANNRFMLRKPYYTLDSNGPQFNGSFLSGRFIQNIFLGLMGKSHFINYFKIEWPQLYSDYNYRLHLALLKSAADSLFNRAKKPAQRKLIWMVLTPSTSERSVKAFKRLAPQFGIDIIDFSDVAYAKAYGDSIHIPVDLHPSETWNTVHAALINREIKHRLSENLK